MLQKELSIRGKPAHITVPNRRSVVIECDGFTATLRELEFLALQRKGKTTKEIARQLHVAPRYVANALSHVRNVNSSPDDNIHHESVAKKAEELELTSPWALEGLRSLLAERNALYDRVALNTKQQSIPVSLSPRSVTVDV